MLQGQCATYRPVKTLSTSSSQQISKFKTLISKERKHCHYKPGSVPTTSVPVIYLLRTSPYVSSVLPSIASLKNRADNPLMAMVYMNLQPPDGTARRSPAGWWSLTPPSHPYPFQDGRGGRSLLPYPAVTNCFYFQKWGVLCCPDFPLAPKRHQRQTAAVLPACKVTNFNLN